MRRGELILDLPLGKIGRVAHVVQGRRLDNRAVSSLPALLDRIRMLIEPTGDASDADLVELENTLTDGYAHALALEGEAWRIKGEIGELARALPAPAEARELRALVLRLAASEEELKSLRRLLVRLRERTDAVRAETAAR